MNDMDETPGPALDPDRLASLRDVDPSLVAEVAALWIETTPKLLTALRDAIGAGDADAAATAAHTLRGSSSNVGADPLAAACGSVEDAGRHGDLAAVTAGLPGVEAEYGRAAAALAALAATA